MKPGLRPESWGVLPFQDPWRNLAWEQALFLLQPQKTWTLWFYLNSPCVVLGRNQNPWREVKMSQAEARGLPVIRRFSGGGTVYQDLGNLNFCFMGPKETYDKPGILSFIIQRLKNLDLEITATPQGDLLYQEKKVSGQAFQVLGDRVLHHGTLLFQADLQALRGVLGCEIPLVSWSGVASRPMSVTNLFPGPGSPGAPDLIRALSAGIPETSLFQGPGSEEITQKAQELEAQLKSEPWTWGKTADFTITTPEGPLTIHGGQDPRTGTYFRP